MDLSNDISARVLASGMMHGKSQRQILPKIKTFLTPEQTKTHGRPIYRDEAHACGLNIEKVDPDAEYWDHVYELYIRTNNFVQSFTAKCIESADHSFSVGPPAY